MQPKQVPIDPDVDQHDGGQRTEPRGGTCSHLLAVAVGGMLGAVARHAVGEALPHQPGEYPWSTFIINVSGCLLIGVLMVSITEVWTAPQLVRPLLGVGVLGGYTTFSTYVLDAQQAVATGHAATGLLSLAVTPVSGLLAVYVGIIVTRLVAGSRLRRKDHR